MQVEGGTDMSVEISTVFSNRSQLYNTLDPDFPRLVLEVIKKLYILMQIFF